MSVVTHEPDCHGFRDERGRHEGICEDWCYAHYRCEPLRDGDYRICFECFHVFRTADELIAAHRAVLEQIGSTLNPRTDPEAIFSCPECSHDF
jgi:hypothetical protein